MHHCCCSWRTVIFFLLSSVRFMSCLEQFKTTDNVYAMELNILKNNASTYLIFSLQ